MNTCDTCVHWKQRAKQRGSAWDLLGDCDSQAWLRGYHITADEIKPDSVHVEDDEGWAFQTGPKFGCIHWRAVSAGASPDG